MTFLNAGLPVTVLQISAAELTHTHSSGGWEVTLSAKPLTEGISLILTAWFQLIRMDVDSVKSKPDRPSLRDPQGCGSRGGAVPSLTASKDLPRAAHSAAPAPPGSPDEKPQLPAFKGELKEQSKNQT